MIVRDLDEYQLWALVNMTGKFKERAEKYKLTAKVKMFPPLAYFGTCAVWCGNFSRSCPELEERFIIKGAAVTIEGEGLTVTPSEIAREYVAWKFPKKLRAKHIQIKYWERFHRSQPQYTEPGYYPDMVYVDLKSAYWSILQVIGWDVEYFEGMIVPGQELYDFPFPENKMARNCLVTVGLPTPSIMYKDGNIIEIPSRKKVNQGLWCAVQDILHGIALDVMDYCRPVYINTDGYIVRAADERATVDLLRSWGLHAEVKHRGDCTVYGAGAYTIGGHVCKTTSRINSPIINLNDVPVSDLKEDFATLARVRSPRY